MEAIELKACVRNETGKGPARRFRMKGLTPAVFYGRGEEAIPLSVNATDLMKIIRPKRKTSSSSFSSKGRSLWKNSA